MAAPNACTRLDYTESPDFLRRLDDLVLAGAAVTVVVALRPPEDSPFYQRIRRCGTAPAPGEALPAAGGSALGLALKRFARYAARLRREPDYGGYLATVRRDVEPLEVHLSPR